MTQYANSGALFKNKHRKSENHPNARGCIKGVTPEMAQKIAETGVIPLAAWTKRGTRKNPDETWQSLSIDEQEFDYYAQQQGSKAQPQQPTDDFDDDIPF